MWLLCYIILAILETVPDLGTGVVIIARDEEGLINIHLQALRRWDPASAPQLHCCRGNVHRVGFLPVNGALASIA